MWRCAWLLLLATVLGAGSGCEKSCHELQREWSDVVAKMDTGCTEDSDCFRLGGFAGGMSEDCTIGGCCGHAVGHEADHEEANSLSRQWNGQRCYLGSACDCFGGCPIRCIHGGCTIVYTEPQYDGGPDGPNRDAGDASMADAPAD